MHVKFEECNALVKNVVEIDSLVEDLEKITLKDSPLHDNDKPKDDEHSEAQDVEVEQIQPLPKDCSYATSYPKDLILGDIFKGVTARSKLLDSTLARSIARWTEYAH